jgi:hypothetical protein
MVQRSGALIALIFLLILLMIPHSALLDGFFQSSWFASVIWMVGAPEWHGVQTLWSASVWVSASTQHRRIILGPLQHILVMKACILIKSTVQQSKYAMVL